MDHLEVQRAPTPEGNQRPANRQKIAATGQQLDASILADSADIPATPPRGPKAHKEMAKQLGIRLNSANELIVLAKVNDPFYMGVPGQIQHARWFAGLLEQYGLQLGAHNRRVHYRNLTGGFRPNGDEYENTPNCIHELGQASNAARILGFIDPEDMVDRRNEDATQNVVPREVVSSPRIGAGWATLYTPELGIRL